MPEQTEGTLLGTWDADSATWRTPDSQLCGHSALFSGTWPSWGMTRGGQAFALPTPEHPTDGSGYSLLPTSQASDWKGPNLSGSGSQSANSLSTVTSLLQTPRSQNGGPRNQNIWQRPLDEPQNLENALARIGAPTQPPSTDGNTSSDD